MTSSDRIAGYKAVFLHLCELIFPMMQILDRESQMT